MKYQPKLQFEDKYNIKDKTIPEIERLIKEVEIDRDLIDALYADKRKTTSKIAVRCKKIYKENKKLKDKIKEYKNIENQIYNKGFDNIYGFYVTGLPAAAGPLTFCSLKLNRFTEIKGIDYIKDLTEKRKKELYNKIKDEVEYMDIFHIEAEVIDRIGLRSSIIKGYKKLKENIKEKEDIDKQDDYFIYYRYGLDDENSKVIKTTNKKVYLLACASILAKTHREDKMIKLADKYNGYGFEKNYGYVTKKHRQAVQKRGFCKIHRKSYDFEKKLKLEF